MGTNTELTIDDSGSSVDPSLYRSMIGSLLYLTASGLNIYFSVGVCVRYQANPKESHLAAVKQIIRLLVEQLMMVFGTLIQVLQDIVMHIGLELLMIEKTPLEDVLSWK